jgi:MFS family permease
MMIMYLGPIAAQLVLVLVGDLFGRKTLALKGFLALTAGCLIIILSINLIMAVAGLFLMMMGASLLYSLCFLFLCETVS